MIRGFKNMRVISVGYAWDMRGTSVGRISQIGGGSC